MQFIHLDFFCVFFSCCWVEFLSFEDISCKHDCSVITPNYNFPCSAQSNNIYNEYLKYSTTMSLSRNHILLTEDNPWILMGAVFFPTRLYYCPEGNIPFVIYQRFVLVTNHWHANINGILLGWAVMLSLLVSYPFKLCRSCKERK